MSRTKVKIFSRNNKHDLEAEINAWLSGEHEVLDIRFSSSDGTYDVLIYYKS